MTDPTTAAGRLFLQILDVQARHVHLPPELTQDFPSRILAIEDEAGDLTKLAAEVRGLRKTAPWPQFGVLHGHEATARDAYGAALDAVLDLIADHTTLADPEPVPEIVHEGLNFPSEVTRKLVQLIQKEIPGLPVLIGPPGQPEAHVSEPTMREHVAAIQAEAHAALIDELEAVTKGCEAMAAEAAAAARTALLDEMEAAVGGLPGEGIAGFFVQRDAVLAELNRRRP